MKRILLVALIGLCGVVANVYAAGLETYAFPQKGQTAEQQKQDEGYCTKWSSDQTGLNPEVLKYQEQEVQASQQQAAAAKQASQPSALRSVGKTALRGAALAGINNGMDSGAGKGAAMGAAVGVAKTRDANKEQQVQGAVDSANAKTQEVQANTQTYLRAYSACMEGKGYSIR